VRIIADRDAGLFELVLVAVKAFQLARAVDDLAPFANSDTAIASDIPRQFGVQSGFVNMALPLAVSAAGTSS